VPTDKETTNDSSERVKIDFPMSKASPIRNTPMSAYKKRNSSYKTDLFTSAIPSFVRKGPTQDHQTDVIMHEDFEDEKVVKSVSFHKSQDLILKGENIVREDFRNDDKEGDKLVPLRVIQSQTKDATTTPSTSRKTISPFSSHTELTQFGVEHEKGSLEKRMRNHVAHYHPDNTPWTRVAKGFPVRLLKLHSIGTRLVQGKNFKQESNPDNISPDILNNSEQPQLLVLSPNTAYTHDDSGFHVSKTEYETTEDLFTRMTPNMLKEDMDTQNRIDISRRKRNAAGDNFRKEFLSQFDSFSNPMPSREPDEHKTSEKNISEEDPVLRSPTAAESLEKLKLLVGKIVQELSQFKQKFTLRLIKMTEREDLTLLPDIMKGFQISPERPIFFIAGGLKTPVPIGPVIDTNATTLTTTSSATTPMPMPTTPTITASIPTTTATVMTNSPSSTITSNAETSTDFSHATENDIFSTTVAPEVKEKEHSIISFLSLPQVLTNMFGREHGDFKDTITTSTKATTSTSASLEPTTGPYSIDGSTTAVSPVELTTLPSAASNDSSYSHASIETSEQNQHHEASKNRKRRWSPRYKNVDFSSSYSHLGRMARTENPFADNERETYYPLLPSFYELRLWPHHDIIRQSQNEPDDDSGLADVDEGLILSLNQHSNPAPFDTESSEVVPVDSQMLSNSAHIQDKQVQQADQEAPTRINLHDINLALPSPEVSALNRTEESILTDSQTQAQPVRTVPENDNKTLPILSPSSTSHYDKEIWTEAQMKPVEPLAGSNYNVVLRGPMGKHRNTIKFQSSEVPFLEKPDETKVEQMEPDKASEELFHFADDESTKNDKIISAKTAATIVNEPEKDTVVSTYKREGTNLVTSKTKDSSETASTFSKGNETDDVDSHSVTEKLLSTRTGIDSNASASKPTPSSKNVEALENAPSASTTRKENVRNQSSDDVTDTQVVKPILLSSSSIQEKSESTTIKPPSNAVSQPLDLQNKVNSTDKVINDTGTIVNEPEKVEEKVSPKFSKSHSTPVDPEVTVAEPHITIMASGSVVNTSRSPEALNISEVKTGGHNNATDNGQQISPIPYPSGKPPNKLESVFNVPKNGTSQESTSAGFVTDKPLEFSVKVSSPILNAATSIIHSLLGIDFGSSKSTNFSENFLHNSSSIHEPQYGSEIAEKLPTQNATDKPIIQMTDVPGLVVKVSDRNLSTATGVDQSISGSEKIVATTHSELSHTPPVISLHEPNGTKQPGGPQSPEKVQTHKSRPSEALVVVPLLINAPESTELSNTSLKVTNGPALIVSHDEVGPLSTISVAPDTANSSPVIVLEDQHHEADGSIISSKTGTGSQSIEVSGAADAQLEKVVTTHNHIGNAGNDPSSFLIPPDHKILDEVSPHLVFSSTSLSPSNTVGPGPTKSNPSQEIFSFSSPILSSGHSVPSISGSTQNNPDQESNPNTSAILSATEKPSPIYQPAVGIPQISFVPMIPVALMPPFRPPPRPVPQIVISEFGSNPFTDVTSLTGTQRMPSEIVQEKTRDANAKRHQYLMNRYFPNVQ
jgi:hypothetical protein